VGERFGGKEMNYLVEIKTPQGLVYIPIKNPEQADQYSRFPTQIFKKIARHSLDGFLEEMEERK